jgi:carbamoyltransferase
MIVLGIGCGHDGSVCLVDNGKMVGFIATERITRFKKERGVTKKAIKYILDKHDVKLADVDLVAVTNWFWDRAPDGYELWDKSKEGFSITKQNGVNYEIADYQHFNNASNVAHGVFTFHIGDQEKPCMLVDHHFAHAASAFYLSPFDKAVTLTVDFSDNMGNGHSVYYFDDIEKYFRPLRKGGDFALGSFYGSICDYLGFYPSLTDAGKVMALAAYGEVNEEIAAGIEWPHNVRMGDLFHGDQFMKLLTRMGVEHIPEQRAYFPQLRKEGGKPDKHWLKKEDWKKSPNKDIAANAQWILELSLQNMVDRIRHDVQQTNNICLAGGTTLNCVANGKLLNGFANMNVFVPPAPGDDGLSIGAAFFISDMLQKNKKTGEIKTRSMKVPKSSHTVVESFEGGMRYSDDDVLSSIKEVRSKVDYEKVDDVAIVAAQAISDNKIVGWFQGGSELGPRALGHRSILANATNPDMKDILNEKVKHREEFRPFAPMVLKEKAHLWFDLPKGVESPFMLFSVACKKPDKIPSGVHIDDTSRVQTLGKENCLIYDVVKEFNRLTKVPVIINTSFNDQGEPIVETPENAIKCFLGTEIDVLIMHDYVITKKGNDE